MEDSHKCHSFTPLNASTHPFTPLRGSREAVHALEGEWEAVHALEGEWEAVYALLILLGCYLRLLGSVHPHSRPFNRGNTPFTPFKREWCPSMSLMRPKICFMLIRVQGCILFE